MKKLIMKVVLISVSLVLTQVEAADRNWNSGANASWNNAATWAEGVVPTSADDVYLNLNSTITISGSDGAAKSVALNNTANTCALIVLDGFSLNVANGITDPGSGDAIVRVRNSTPASAATRLVTPSMKTRAFETTGFVATDFNITLAVQHLLASSADNLYTQTDGIISSANDGYGLSFFETTSYPSSPNTAYYILDGGTMAHDRIGVGNGNGNNITVTRWIQYGVLTFNNGTIQNRSENGNVYFQNGNGFLNYTGSGDKDMQRAVHHPLTVELSENGTHTFNVRGSSGVIYVSPSAQFVDKQGEAGTLRKIGDGDLLFTGGAPLGNAPDGSPYAVNSWSGSTTVEVGRVVADFNSIAGYAGSSALTNAYSPASKLVLNGGGFVMTGRENAVATNQTVTLNNKNYYYDVTNHGLLPGQPVVHADLPVGTHVRRVVSSLRFELSHMATAATSAAVLDFGATTNSSYQMINEVELRQDAIIVVNHGGTSTLLEMDKISGAGRLIKAGNGRAKINDFSEYAAPVVVNNGTLEYALDSGSALITNSVTGGTSGIVAKSGNGTLIISSSQGNANTFSGALSVESGILQIGNADIGNITTQGMRNVSAVSIASGATLALRNSSSLGGSGSVSVFLDGTLMNYSAGITAGGFFNPLGPITMSGGTLQTGRGANSDNWQSFSLCGDVTVVGSAPSSIIAGGGPGDSIHLEHNAAGNRSFNVADVTGSADPDLITSVNFADASQSRDVVGLIKSGSGTMALNAASVYSGDTLVSEGTLLVNNTSGSATGSGDISVLSGAALGGTGAVITDNLTLNAGSTLKVTVADIPAGEFFQATVLSGGSVNLAGALLEIDDVDVPDNDKSIKIIDNQSGIAVNGVFEGYAEGGKIITATNKWRITYVGGDGDDVVLIPLPQGTALIIL